jgi:hypothetical protein
MTEYIVKIDERFTHTLTVEAGSPDEATDKAYQMLSDGLTTEDEKACDYTFEADGYTGQHSVEVA